jgi:FHS family L-fucose permease-like MFS transporter
MNTEQKSYALPIAMMFALFFMIAFVTGLPSPMGVILAKQFQASNFQSQLGFLGNFIAYAFMGIPAGIMLKKYGYKKTALSAVAVGFVGVSVQFLSGQVGSF